MKKHIFKIDKNYFHERDPDFYRKSLEDQKVSRTKILQELKEKVMDEEFILMNKDNVEYIAIDVSSCEDVEFVIYRDPLYEFYKWYNARVPGSIAINDNLMSDFLDKYNEGKA